jgi:HK97 family phage major capsid protein
MRNIESMKVQLSNFTSEVRSLIGNETRSAEDNTRIDSLMSQAEALKADIAREERAQALAMSEARKDSQYNADERSTFSSFGEFIQTLRYKPQDERLTRDLSMSNGSEGGVLVPTTFRDQIMMVNPQGGIFRSRATVIPADAAHPDAGITMPAIDYAGGRDVYGGVSVSWISEGALKPETQPVFTDISLQPKEVAAHIVLTDKLLRNASAVNTTVRSLLASAILAAEDDAFLNGNGVGKPLGVISAPATIGATRATASTIGYVDVVGMYSKAKFGGSLVWVASQSILPKLLNLVDGDGRLIWQPNAAVGAPGTLFGLPVLLNERSPQLGTAGDLVLMDASYYLIKDGTSLSISASEHVLFRENKTVIKAFWNVDGQPWVKSKLTQEGGYEVSPFIRLNA